MKMISNKKTTRRCNSQWCQLFTPKNNSEICHEKCCFCEPGTQLKSTMLKFNTDSSTVKEEVLLYEKSIRQ